jgi:hypothetical protein
MIWEVEVALILSDGQVNWGGSKVSGISSPHRWESSARKMNVSGYFEPAGL